MAKSFHQSHPYCLPLALIFFAGLLLRCLNISRFNIYPDSYLSLVVADNLAAFHSVVGRLGPQGMLYPDYFPWTRPLYPLLVAAAGLLIGSGFTAAHVISLVCSLGAILLAYLLVSRMFNSRPAGLTAALLLALSFNHTVWSGFILTESTGVFIMILFLLSLFSGLGLSSVWAEFSDILTGVLLALAILCRYEYLLIIIPVVFLVLASSPVPVKKLLNILSPAFLIGAVYFAYLLPPFLLSGLISQGRGNFKILAVGSIGLLIFLLIHRFKYFNYLVIAAVWVLSLLAYFRVGGFRDFVNTDFLIIGLWLIGVTKLLRLKKKLPLIYFCLIGIFLLAAVYVRTNILMQRYWTHLLPFFIIPAAFAFSGFAGSRFFRIPIFILFILQGVITYRGLKYWQNGAWFNGQNYEEAVAARLKTLTARHDLILVSRPEPYYLITGNNTYSISRNYPYIYIDSRFDGQNIFIVNDAGMFREFPEFSRFILKYLQPYAKTSFPTGLPFYSTNRIFASKIPLTIYEIKLSELKNLLNSHRH